MASRSRENGFVRTAALFRRGRAALEPMFLGGIDEGIFVGGCHGPCYPLFALTSDPRGKADNPVANVAF
jgi:hypothetical protein